MTKRLLAVVLMLAMLVTMASFPASAADYAIAKLDGLNASNVTYSGATLRNAAKQNMDTLFDGDLTRTASSAAAINGIQFNWTGSTTVKNVVITLNDVTDVAELKLYWGNADWNAFPAQTYNVYFAGEDGTYGEAAYSRPDDAATSQNGKSRDDVLTFDTPIEDVKSIKIEITSHYATGDPALREIEIFVVGDPASYTVEYVDEDGNAIIAAKTVDGIHGGTSTETAPAFEGYTLVSDETVSIVLDKDATNKITFTYKKLAAVDYTISYVDEEGNPIADAVVKSSYETLTATATAIDVFGYELIGEKTVTITLDAAVDNVIEFVYKKLPSIEYTVKYVDASGNEIAPSKVGTAIAPYEVTENGVYVEGYYTPAPVTKTVSEDDKVIEIVYEAYSERMVDTVENLLINATVTTSGQDNNKNVAPEHLIDNDNSTFSQANWTKNPNYTAIIDLHGNYDIDNISLLWCGGTTQKWDTTNGGVRATKYTIAVSTDGTEYTTVYTYNDTTRSDSRDNIAVSDFTVTPKSVRYVKINFTEAYLTGRTTLYEVDINGYATCDRVISAPDIGLYATGSTAVDFPMTIKTVDNVDPITYMDAANWILDNCAVEVTTENVSDPASIYYTWEVNVKAIPVDNTLPFSMDLDLPESFFMTDGFSYYLEPSDLLFNSVIAAGQNAIKISKTDIVLNYNEDGTLTDASAKVENRSINVEIDIQSVIEKGLPYEGYDEVVIELKEFKANGDRVRFYLDEFVFVNSKYYAKVLVTKAGVERLEAVIALYGVNADGTKDELETRTIYSDLINIEAKYPVPKTEAQLVRDYTFPMDVLDQLVDYVHPADLPTYSDDEWAFFKEILIARGWTTSDDPAKDKAQIEIDRVRNLVNDARADLEDPNWIPTIEYAEDTVKIINRRTKVNTPGSYETVIRMGTTVWNMLADLHVDSFSVVGPIDRPSSTQQKTGFENDIEGAYLTFRRGIDFDPVEKFVEGNGFCIRIKFVGASAEYANVKLGNAYNAVRRALNNDQLSPILFRLDWYNWGKNPFEGGVITVQLTENWVENYGLFNLATYHMAGYKYSDDNDPTLTLMEEGVAIANPLTREVSVVIEGAAKMYDSYAIVGTEVIPSDEPEVNGTYFDVN